MVPLGPTPRREHPPQVHGLFHPLDGIPRPGSTECRFQNRHRTRTPSPLVTPTPRAIARCVGTVLLLAATLQLMALGMRSPSLQSPHPLLPWLTTRQVVFLAATVEALAGLGTLASRRQGLVLVAPSMCLATLSGYHAVATWLHPESSCNSLRPNGHGPHWSPATEQAITLWALLGCLLLMTVAWWSQIRNGGGTAQGPLPVPHRPPA